MQARPLVRYAKSGAVNIAYQVTGDGPRDLIDRIAGIGVHVGARIAALAHPGEVWVSRTVRDLVARSGLVFAERGAHPLKGLDEEWALYAAAAL